MEDIFMIIDQMKGENNITNPKYIYFLKQYKKPVLIKSSR